MNRLALDAIRGCGVFSLARVLSAKMARVLMYHNFRGPGEADENALNVVDARRQFEYLRRYFHVVPLHHIVDQLTSSQGFDSNTGNIIQRLLSNEITPQRVRENF